MDDYALACAPEPYRILGIELRPYSLGHQILLKRFENGFVTGTGAGIADLAHGLLICSRRYQDAVTLLADKERSRDALKELLVRIRELDKPEVLKRFALFSRYLSDGRRAPENVLWSEGGSELASSPEARLKVGLMAKLGYSEERVLDGPYSQFVYEFCVWQEAEDIAKFYDPEEQAQLQQLANEAERKMSKKSKHERNAKSKA